MNPNVRGPVHRILGELSNVRLTPPLSYIAFVKLATSYRIVLTPGYHLERGASNSPLVGSPTGTFHHVGRGGDKSPFHRAAGAVLPRVRTLVRLGQHTGPRRYTRRETFSVHSRNKRGVFRLKRRKRKRRSCRHVMRSAHPLEKSPASTRDQRPIHSQLRRPPLQPPL